MLVLTLISWMVHEIIKHLAGTDYYITTQMPPEVVESKRKLTPLFKQARAQGNRPRYVARGDAVAYGNKTIRAPMALR